MSRLTRGVSKSINEFIPQIAMGMLYLHKDIFPTDIIGYDAEI